MLRHWYETVQLRVYLNYIDLMKSWDVRIDIPDLLIIAPDTLGAAGHAAVTPKLVLRTKWCSENMWCVWGQEFSQCLYTTCMKCLDVDWTDPVAILTSWCCFLDASALVRDCLVALVLNS